MSGARKSIGTIKSLKRKGRILRSGLLFFQPSEPAVCYQGMMMSKSCEP